MKQIVVMLLFLSIFGYGQSGAGQALTLDGNGDFVDLPESNSLTSFTDKITIEAWIKISSFANEGVIICSGNQNDYYFGYRPSGKLVLYFYPSPQNLESKALLSLDVWYHVVASYDGAQQKIYINGQFDTSRSQTGNIGGSGQSEDIAISKYNNDGCCNPNNFNGFIEELRVWNVARTQTEVQNNKNISLLGNESGLVGYWKFDGNANDLSSNGNNGTTQGDANFVTSTAPINSNQTIDTSTVWRMQIQASIASIIDDENFAGVSDSATDLQDASFDTAEPPASPGNYVSLYFPHAEWNSLTGDNFARDIKKNFAFADTVKRWYFQVTSNVVNDTVTITFVNDRIPTSFGKYLTDLKTGQRINLKNISTYNYFNTSDTARSFMLIIGDSTAPSLTLNMPNGSNIWRSGISKNITWNTSDGTGIDSVWVYYSSNAGSSYSLLSSLGIVQLQNWTVPNEYLNHNYSVKIIARDSLGNQSSVRSTKTFTVVGDSLASTNTAGWSLISTPLSPNDSSVSNIFGNTSYLWSYTQSTGYTQPSKIALGNGYWLGVTATKNWNVKGIANETDSSVQNLQPGYNIIGNNFVRNVSKANLYFLKSGSYYDFSSAVSGGLISNSLYGYSSSMYSSVDTMSLFGGYWIGVLQSGVQLIQKPNNSVVTPLAKQSQSFALNWELPIKVTTVNLADNIATIGIKPSSSNQFDALYDAPRPPRNPGSNYLEMYFTNSGGNYPAVLGSKYAKDFRDSSSANWNFTIEGSQNGDVTLLWNKTLLEGLAGSLQLDLKDFGNGIVIDMKQIGNYTFVYSTPRLFSINAKITSVEKQKKNLPTEFSLSQNYPNPFNPTTTIQYQLPVSGIVNLKVFDVLGKEIATLVNKEQEPGNYSVLFNASNLTSGIYFYKLQSGNFIQVKKMQLIK